MKASTILQRINKVKLPTGDLILLVIFISLFIQFLYFGIEIEVGFAHNAFRFWAALADASLFLLPVLLLRGKWKLLELFILLLTPVLLMANILYFRFFGDFIPSSSYFNSASYNAFTIQSGLTGFKVNDLFFGVVAFMPILLVLLNLNAFTRCRYNKVWLKTDLILVGATWLTTFIGAYVRAVNHTQYTASQVKEIFNFITNTPTGWDFSWRFTYEFYNFTGYLTYCLLLNSQEAQDLSEEETEMLKNYFIEKSEGFAGIYPTEVPDSLKPQNLIMIIVESWSTPVMELDYAKTLMPNVFEYLSLPNTIMKESEIYISAGRSSDAQFMYNTGLLPLINDSFTSRYALNDYPSIAKALNVKSLEIMAESQNVWNHYETTRSFGFDNIVDNLTEIWEEADSLIFSRAAHEIKQLAPPFFCFIATITMHNPYLPGERDVKHNLDLGSFGVKDERVLEYYKKVNNFDTNLGVFIEALKKMGKYDNTVIIITGDHEPAEQDIPKYMVGTHVPFMILNAPDVPIREGDMTQIDVFPTVLDLMGVKYEYMGAPYRGLGKSIFDMSPDARGYKPTDRDYEISEKIIKADLPLK